MAQLNVTSFTAHTLGVASLQVSCDGHVISNSVPFRFVAQDSKDKNWFSLWGKNNLFDGNKIKCKVCVCVEGFMATVVRLLDFRLHIHQPHQRCNG